MYKWNKEYINCLIKNLEAKEQNELIKSDIKTLKSLKTILITENYERKINNKNLENDYNIVKQFNHLINPIIKKYENKTKIKVKYNKLEIPEKELLIFTYNNIKKINKNWANLVEPYIFTKYNLNFKKKNNNYIIPLEYYENFFISLSKENTIEDYINPTHEYLHVLWGILNINTMYYLEAECLSILGELITTYEFKKNSILKEEAIKYDIKNINRLYSFIKDIQIKKELIKIDKKYIPNILEKYNINKKYLNELYESSIIYDYRTTLSYLIAIELFELYKQDKEKCIYIIENLIKDEDNISSKLKKNNITLLTNDDKYIKTLKKEYEDYK